VKEVELGLLAVTPARHLRHAHHYLILHGRYVCTARKPRCGQCPIRRDCAWPEKTEG
jgi:endonuclease-3